MTGVQTCALPIWAAVEKYGEGFLQPGGLVSNPLDAISLGIALMFGTAGLPHILMRFYTVPNAKEARKSVFYATGFIGYFYILTFTIGFGAAILVGREVIAGIDKGGNMAAPLLAEVLGGNMFLGFLAAVAFATILAVVAGLTLAGASALSHDLYAGVFRQGRTTENQEVKVAKAATVGLGVVAILLGIFFKGQNVAFMVGLAFAVAASANFPSLFLAIFWRRFTTAGAVAGILTGLGLAVVLIVLSPTVWVDILKHPAPVFPLKNPGLFSMSGGILAAITVSLAGKKNPDAQRHFSEQKLRSFTGVGAE